MAGALRMVEHWSFVWVDVARRAGQGGNGGKMMCAGAG